MVLSIAVGCFLWLGTTASFADPWLELVKAGTLSTSSDSITLGTASYGLGLRLNTDGNLISGVQYCIETTPASALTYGATPLTVLNNPFPSGDLQLSPSSGATVGSSAITAFFSFSQTYAAFSDNAIANYSFNTASLGVGTYVFTPVGQSLTTDSTEITTFNSPGTFSLQVTAGVPEPGTCALLGLGGLSLVMHRRRRA